MKKFLAVVMLSIMTIGGTADTFAYTKNHHLAFEEKIVFNADGSTSERKQSYANSLVDAEEDKSTPLMATSSACFDIKTTDYIMKNGTAMVKIRDMLSIVEGGASFTYNPQTKEVKAYLMNKGFELGMYSSGIETRSILVSPETNIINYSYVSYAGEKDVISQASLTAKIKPEIIGGSLYVSAIDLNKVMRGNYEAFIRNGILYIPYGYV